MTPLELCLDDDGDVSIDCRTPDGDALSISFRANGAANMAWITGAAHGHASIVMPPQVFAVLLKLVVED